MSFRLFPSSKIGRGGWLACLAILALLHMAWAAQAADDKLRFWDEQKKGANFFDDRPDPNHFRSAAEVGIRWARLAFDKWQGEGRDFLMGDADEYTRLVEADMLRLEEVLGWADQAGIKVVVAPLSLPGARWRQNNDDEFDGRLWEDKHYWYQAAAYWRDLAARLKDNPAVVAYNIVNEPAPEHGTDAVENVKPGDTAAYVDWYQKHRGTARDLPAFYQTVIDAIRSVDADTPIMVDSGWYANPGTFSSWPAPLRDPRVLYAVHMYEPYAFTSEENFREKHGYIYPGVVPFGDKVVEWNAGTIATFLQPFYDWAQKNGIPANRLVASEFGCMRRNQGCAAYLSDVIANLNAAGIHWAFYAYRESDYDGYDYELGDGGLGADYWSAISRGETPPRPYAPNPLFDAILQGLAE